MTVLEVDEEVPIRPRSKPTGADRVFRGVAFTAAAVSLLIVVGIFGFLLNGSRPAFRSSGFVHFFTSSVFTGKDFGVVGLAENTALIALVAVCLGVPVSLGMAVFVNEYAPRSVGRIMTSAIDLLAAMPSLLFGVWGRIALAGPIVKLATWFYHHLSFIPAFHIDAGSAGTDILAGSTFQAGIVVGIMIIPIVTSVSRDVMSQVPREQCEGALALGGTRWGMVRDVILPFGRSGIVGGVLLGLGRALGETIAILSVVSQVVAVNTHILTTGSGSIASLIALRFGTGGPLETSGLVAAGLTLFLITLVVNIAARIVVSRTGRFA